ncbi:MAG: hypothetical protein ACT4P6_20120 [Gemmatimonadaceae bacterium]
MATSLAALLAAPPDPVLPTSRVVGLRPALAADLPSLAVGVTLADPSAGSPARFLREGDQIVRRRLQLVVQAEVDGFSADLRFLDLTPPVRRAPAVNIEEGDVVIANLTTPSTPVPYRVVERPTSAEEYRVDFARARVVFGAPQQAGDRLEVNHWTVAWREPLRAELQRGALHLELWTSSAGQATTLAARLQDRCAAPGSRTYGFIRLDAQAVEPAESLQHSSGVAGAFVAWRQRLAYAFAHEFIAGGEDSGGAAIRRIDVTMDDVLPDSLTIGR